MAGTGRQALDEAKQREICAILSVGGSRRTAARYVGCAVSTIRRTALRDPEFDLRLRSSEARFEIVNLQSIHAAGKKTWRAAAWALERKFPDQYAQRAPGTVTAEQISLALAQFAQIVAEEVPRREDRQRILQRVRSLASSFATTSKHSPQAPAPRAMLTHTKRG